MSKSTKKKKKQAPKTSKQAEKHEEVHLDEALTVATDSLRKFFVRYRNHMLGVVALLIVVFGVLHLLESRQNARANSLNEEFERALRGIDEDDAPDLDKAKQIAADNRDQPWGAFMTMEVIGVLLAAEDSEANMAEVSELYEAVLAAHPDDPIVVASKAEFDALAAGVGFVPPEPPSVDSKPTPLGAFEPGDGTNPPADGTPPVTPAGAVTPAGDAKPTSQPAAGPSAEPPVPPKTDAESSVPKVPTTDVPSPTSKPAGN